MYDFWTPLQDVIKTICSDFDGTWQMRKRTINTHFLVLFVFKLVLSKNKQGYSSVLCELWDSPYFQELSLPEKTVAASSVCEARQKMHEEIFTLLNDTILNNREADNPLPLWNGLQVYGVDGSKVNLPHELLDAGYKAPNRNQYYPQGLMSALYHLGSGLVYDCVLEADKDERTCLIQHMDKLLKTDVLVLDRGYFSYLVLHTAVGKGINLICRLQLGSMNKEIKRFWESDLTNSIIEYTPSDAVKSDLKKRGHNIDCRPIKLRLIKYIIGEETYLCATTLLDSVKYKTSDFKGAYHARWGIEELYKISKNIIDVEDFHSKTERGVKQELYAHALLINLGRIFEQESNC